MAGLSTNEFTAYKKCYYRQADGLYEVLIPYDDKNVAKRQLYRLYDVLGVIYESIWTNVPFNLMDDMPEFEQLSIFDMEAL